MAYSNTEPNYTGQIILFMILFCGNKASWKDLKLMGVVSLELLKSYVW